MPKFSKEVKAETAKRLKQVLKHADVTQKELAGKIGRSAQTVNAMVKGTAPLTEKTAIAINALYPDYSVEWLMGKADYPNQREQNLAVYQRAQEEADLLSVAFDALCKLNGYTYTATSPAQPKADGLFEATEFVAAIREGFTVSDGKRSGHLSFDELHDLKNEICDFAAFKLGRIVKTNNDAQ